MIYAVINTMAAANKICTLIQKPPARLQSGATAPRRAREKKNKETDKLALILALKGKGFPLAY